MKNTSFFSAALSSNSLFAAPGRRFRPLMTGLLLVAATVCADTAAAQSRFGLLAGQNIGSFRLDPGEGINITEKAGFTAGFFLEPALGDYAALHFTTMYVQKGGIIENNYDGLDIKLNYIEEQIMLKVGRGVFVEGGFSLAALLSARGKAYGENGDIKEIFTGMDFGFIAGAGIRIGIVNIEARYGGSLISALREDIDGEMFNRGIQLLAGFSIPLD